MSTKNNPGKFDCYEKAEPDEEMFVLLARDPLASFLVAIWAAMRRGDLSSSFRMFNLMVSCNLGRYTRNPDSEKAIEAIECAHRMSKYFSTRIGG